MPTTAEMAAIDERKSSASLEAIEMLGCCNCRCAAVHPGYGFLSENAEFVESMEAAGVAFLGPTAGTMRMFSRKHTAREFAISANVPVLPGRLT